MKKKLFAPLFLVWLLVCTILAPGLRAQGYGGGAAGGALTIKNINVSTPNTPQFTIVGGDEKRYDIKKWLEVEVEFSSTAVMTPEVTLRYYILLAGTLLTGRSPTSMCRPGRACFR